MMKKILCLLLFPAVMTGCSNAKETENTQPYIEETTEETTEAEDTNSEAVFHNVPDNFIVPIKYFDYNEKDYSDKYTTEIYDNSIIDNDVVYMKIKKEYPVFKESNEAITKINEDIKKFITDYADRYRQKCLDNGIMDVYISTEYTNYNNSDFIVERCDDKIISILFIGDQFAGGFHPDTYYSTRTYNAETGELMELSDFMDNPLENVKRVVLDRSKYEKAGLFYGTEKHIKYEEIKFYIKEDKIVVVFHPYEIGCYAAGPQEFRFWMSDEAINKYKYYWQ